MACPDDNLLVAMVERSLDPAQFAEIEVHIDSCESCRRIIAAAVADSALAVGTPNAPTLLAGDELEPIATLVDVSINDRYVIEAVLGKGGMGTVYLARDKTLDRDVAIKLHHRAGSSSERLHREAMAMAKLAHPNVVTVYEVATIDERLYVAMEYVKGETLRGWRQAEPRTWSQVVTMLVETGKGLAAAHAAGLVHRDFKPENVLVGDDGRPRVGDFGLARVGAAPSGDKPISLGSSLEQRMTQTGALVGTPAYMAPEQLAGEVVDARGDQFAFCVVAWELLYGKRPFAGTTLVALQGAIVEQRFTAPARSDVPLRVRRVLERGLRVDPDARHADMPALLGALRAAARPRTRRWVAVGVAAAVLLAGGGVAARSLLQKQHEAAACDAAEAQMQVVFDPLVRTRARLAFIASGVPDAAATFDRTEKVLVRHVNALAAQAGKTCRVFDEPRLITAARLTCLTDERRSLASFVELLGHPDTGVVTRSTSAAWAMYQPAPCEDVQTLLARAKTQVATPPEVSAQLGHIDTLEEVGRYEEALALARPLVEAAHARGDRNAELDGSIHLGRLYAHLEDVEHTQSFYDQAISLAETMGRDLDAAIGYTALANHHGVVTNDYAAAHRAIGLARAKLERLGNGNPALHGELLMTEAQIFADENRLGEAERAMREAASTIENAYGPEHPKLGAAYGTLSQILRYQNKIEEALATAQKALTVLTIAYGPEHAYVAGAEMTLGQSFDDVGRYSEALERYARADKLFAKIFGEVHPARIAIAANIGSVQLHLKQFDKAEASFRRALAMIVQIKGPVHMDACAARGDVARAIAMSGRPREALAEQEKVVHDCYEKLGADGEPRLVGGLLDLAHYQVDTKQPLAVVATAERALGILSHRPADANPAEVGEAKYLLAVGLWDSSTKPADHARARKLAFEAQPAPLNEDIKALLETWLAQHPAPD